MTEIAKDGMRLRPEFEVPRLNAAGFEALVEVGRIFSTAMDQLDQLFTEIERAVPTSTVPNAPRVMLVARERALVVTKMQEAMSWARLAVAKDPRVAADHDATKGG
jgi:hypothetical protein